MKVKNYLLLSCAMLVLAWTWVYSVSGQTKSAPEAAKAKAAENKSSKLGNKSLFKAGAPGDDLQICAAMCYSEEWDDGYWDDDEEDWVEDMVPVYGIYSVATSDDVVDDLISDFEDRNCAGGAVYADGIFYGISYTTDSNGRYSDIFLTAYDAETWDVVYEKSGLETDILARDLTYDWTTGTIYGCFLDSYLCNWGKLDVDSGTVEIIKENMTSLQAVAATPEGKIYGITSSGSLVAIDKETGEVSEPLAEYGVYLAYKSTAAVDPKTGYMYWLADSYGGNNGVYKIDLKSY